MRCGGSACVDPVTDASGFPYRVSFHGGLGWCTRAVLCGRRHRPSRVGGRHARVLRVCVCVLFLAGLGGPASWARFGAPHLSTGRSWCALCLFSPLRAGVAPACGCCRGVFFFPFPLPPLVAPPLCPALRVFRPRVPWALASCRPPPPPHPPLFFSPSHPLCAPRCLLLFVFSGLGCLGPRPPVAPPPPSVFFLFFAPPLLSLAFPAFWLPWAFGPPPLFLSPPFFFFFLPVLRCGGGLCVLSCRVCPRVPRWCCPCCCSVCASWCCVVLAVGPRCPVLSLGGSWCRASVVMSLSGRVARRPVVWRGVSWCSSALCCVLLRCAVMWWCAVVLCRLFASLPVPVVCFLPLRVCCVCSGLSCCVFPVLSALWGAVLRCAGALSLCCARRLCCSW